MSLSITRRSSVTGIVRTFDLDITIEQYNRWNNTRALIQDVFPHLSADDREFILSGITPDEWDAHFGEMGE